MKTPSQLAEEYFLDLPPPRKVSATSIMDAFEAGFKKALECRNTQDNVAILSAKEKAEESYKLCQRTAALNRTLREMGLDMSQEDFSKMLSDNEKNND